MSKIMNVVDRYISNGSSNSLIETNDYRFFSNYLNTFEDLLKKAEMSFVSDLLKEVIKRHATYFQSPVFCGVDSEDCDFALSLSDKINPFSSILTYDEDEFRFGKNLYFIENVHPREEGEETDDISYFVKESKMRDEKSYFKIKGLKKNETDISQGFIVTVGEVGSDISNIILDHLNKPKGNRIEILRSLASFKDYIFEENINEVLFEKLLGYYDSDGDELFLPGMDVNRAFYDLKLLDNGIKVIARSFSLVGESSESYTPTDNIEIRVEMPKSDDYK